MADIRQVAWRLTSKSPESALCTCFFRMHEVEAEGAFGRFRFEITGASLPDNPRSSALAAMSVLAEIRRLTSTVTT